MGYVLAASGRQARRLDPAELSVDTFVVGFSLESYSRRS
jgi:hypothetical protein